MGKVGDGMNPYDRAHREAKASGRDDYDARSAGWAEVHRCVLARKIRAARKHREDQQRASASTESV